MTQIIDDTKVFVDHNVYILGAGFSADAGIPVLDDFLFQMRGSLNWLQEQGRDREFESIREVLKFRKEAASAALRVNLNIENIEGLFSLAAASGQYPLAQSVSSAIAATLDYSRRTAKVRCFTAEVENLPKFQVWKMPDGGYGAPKYLIPFYDLYAGLLSGSVCSGSKFMQNTIITFNYDTVLEDALDNLKAPFWYGFKPRSVEYDRSSKCTRKESTDALPILKLHGSVNWAERPKAGLRIYGSYSDVLAADKRVVLIPPTWRKIFPAPLSEVWDAAIHALSEATRVVIIGFSVPPTDLHFKFLLAAGLRENISLRTVSCFNPGVQVEKNLFRILRRELKNQKMAAFYPNYTHDLCIQLTKDHKPLCSLFNREFSASLSEIRLGPEVRSLMAEWAS